MCVPHATSSASIIHPRDMQIAKGERVKSFRGCFHHCTVYYAKLRTSNRKTVSSRLKSHLNKFPIKCLVFSFSIPHSSSLTTWRKLTLTKKKSRDGRNYFADLKNGKRVKFSNWPFYFEILYWFFSMNGYWFYNKKELV